jgi:hypothetical protein
MRVAIAPRALRSGGVRALAVAALVLAVIVARVLWAGHAEYACGKAAEASGSTDRAITCYRRALGWYVPGSPYVERSIAGLTAIAARAEQAGNLELAIAAQRAITAGLSSARSSYVPHRAAFETAEQRTRALVDREHPGATPPAPPRDPNPALALLAFLGWLGFVASAFGLVLRGLDEAGRLRGAARYGAGLAAGAAVFALSLWLA